MDLRRFRVGDLPAVQELSAGSIRAVCQGDYTPAQPEVWANRAGRITARRLSDCYTLAAEEEGICWALEIWSRADIWSACIRQRTASAGLFHTKQTHKNSPDGGN